MKKAKLFSILLVCLLVLVGCSKKDDKKENKKEEQKKLGESFEIKLDSNSSTGYNWTYDVVGDDAVVLSYKYEDGEGCEDRVGCGGYEIYTVTASSKGKVNIKFTYARPNDDTDSLEANYEVTVDKDLKIKETHSGSYFEK